MREDLCFEILASSRPMNRRSSIVLSIVIIAVCAVLCGAFVRIRPSGAWRHPSDASMVAHFSENSVAFNSLASGFLRDGSVRSLTTRGGLSPDDATAKALALYGDEMRRLGIESLRLGGEQSPRVYLAFSVFRFYTEGTMKSYVYSPQDWFKVCPTLRRFTNSWAICTFGDDDGLYDPDLSVPRGAD